MPMDVKRNAFEPIVITSGCFWKIATIKEQKELCFNYMGFDEHELCEARCSVDEQYEIVIPQAIVEMANLE